MTLTLVCLSAAAVYCVHRLLKADRQRNTDQLVERTHAVVIPFPSVPRSFTSGQVTRRGDTA